MSQSSCSRSLGRDVMRSADLATIIRTLLIVLFAYLVILKFNAIAIIVLFVLIIALDGVDGFLAVREESNGAIGLIYYLRASMGNEEAHARVKQIKLSLSKKAPHGARIDVAGDRVVEYVPWLLFMFLHIVPLFVVIIIVIRHSFADALMASRGTSSKMKSGFARVVYASNASRAGINIMKLVTFSYLVLVYVLAYPLWIGYVLIALLVIYVLARGIAEIYESLK